MENEVADGRCDLRGVRLQRNMSNIEEADDRIRDVALERFGARWQEERIVLAPHSQEAWLVGPEVVLEGRVEGNVALVVTKQIELHFIGAGRVK